MKHRAILHRASLFSLWKLSALPHADAGFLTIMMRDIHHNRHAGTSATRDAVVVLDPVTEWRETLNAIKKKNMVSIAVTCNPLTDRDDISRFLPNNLQLREAGFDIVLPVVLDDGSNSTSLQSSSSFSGFDVYGATQRIKLLEVEENFIVRGVIPLAETGVEYSDTISALLGISSHNPLDTVLARRDKALMKEAASKAGLRVAKFARVKGSSDFPRIVSTLELEYPLVVKTPQGFSTTDVFICSSQEEAMSKIDIILSGGGGPDCRVPLFALVEEYIGGDEMAINIIASPTLKGGIECTDAWLYKKTITEGSARYGEAEMMDPNDYRLCDTIAYAKHVAKAVGIVIGMGHVELKATYCTEREHYIDPCLIEVGARPSGGRKAAMTMEAVEGWNPYDALIDSHCGNFVKTPATFTPMQHARHIFLPHSNSGTITRIDGVAGFDSLESYHSHFILSGVGDVVEPTTDITSCCGFVWLVGRRSAVEADAELIRQTFAVHTEAIDLTSPENEPCISVDRFGNSHLGEVVPGLFVGDISSTRYIDTIIDSTACKVFDSGNGCALTVVTLLSSSMLTGFTRDCIARKMEELKSKGIFIRHVIIKLKDNGDPHFLSGPLPIALEAIDDALSSSSDVGKKYCLIHCAKGESRSPSVAAAWLMLRREMSLQEAWTKIRRARPSANPNLGFIAALRAIEVSNKDLGKAAERISAKE